MAEVATQESRKLTAIRAYTQAAFTLVPLCPLRVLHNHDGRPCKTPGKVPYRKGWQNAKPGQFKEEVLLKENYGVVLQEDDVVVDVDPRNFKPGDEPLKRLVEKVGPLLPTYAVKSGGGGYHFYFKKPLNTPIMNAVTEFPGIEFKSAGQHVVGPGCLHLSGKEYALATGNLKEIADAPTALLALISRPAPEFSQSGTGQYTDDAETQVRFLNYLKEGAKPSIQGQGGDANAYRVACHGRDLGLSPAVAFDLMLEAWNPRCTPAWEPSELHSKVEHAYHYARGAAGGEHPSVDFEAVKIQQEEYPNGLPWETFGQSGKLTKSFHNLMLFFKHPPAKLPGVFGFNDFTQRVEFANSAPWHDSKLPSFRGITDADLKLLKAHLVKNHDFEMVLGHIEEAVTVAAHANRFHPVREYLDSLTWDGQSRADFWLRDFLQADDTPYVRAVSRKFLCAAVMRIMRPGIKFDHVPVLEGRQGIGKSSVCRILAGEWGSDAPVDPHSKDTIHLMQGRWIIELAELEVQKRADLQALRAFITRETDQARLAYQRTVQEFPRQSVFIGSINPGADGTYLKDDENRRWWPIACGEGPFDLKGLKKSRNQLFAEAVALCKKGEALHMDTPELRELQRAEVDKRRAEHPWGERIARWLQDVQSKPETAYTFLTVRDVWLGALGGSDKALDRFATAGVTEVLKHLGWEQARGEKGAQRGWVKKGDTLGGLA